MCEVGAFPLIKDGKGASVVYWGEKPVVRTAIDMLINDSKLVAKEPISESLSIDGRTILVGVLGENKKFDALFSKKYPII